jgi:hypothetical protein
MQDDGRIKDCDREHYHISPPLHHKKCKYIKKINNNNNRKTTEKRLSSAAVSTVAERTVTEQL